MKPGKGASMLLLSLFFYVSSVSCNCYTLRNKAFLSTIDFILTSLPCLIVSASEDMEQ